MMEYEQLSMFAMNVEPVTVTCCMDGCPARASRWNLGWQHSSRLENMWCRLLDIRWFYVLCPADRPTSSVDMNTTTI